MIKCTWCGRFVSPTEAHFVLDPLKADIMVYHKSVGIGYYEHPLRCRKADLMVTTISRMDTS